MTPPEQDHGKLQEALAQLRPKTPPPDFSSKVRDRLEHPEPPPPPSLLQRVGLDFEARTVLVGLGGIVVCFLLVYAVMEARHVKPPPEADPTLAPSRLSVQPDRRPLSHAIPPSAQDAAQSNASRSTDPVLAVPASADRVPVRALPATGGASSGGK